MEEVCHRRQPLSVYSLAPLPAPAAMSSRHDGLLSLWNLSQNKLLLPQVTFGHDGCLITGTEK